MSQEEGNSNRKGEYLCPCLLIATVFYMKLSLDGEKKMMGLKNDCSHVLTMEIFMALLWVLPHFPTGPTVTEKELKEFSSSIKDVFFSCKMMVL